MNSNVRKGLCYLLALVMVANPTVLVHQAALGQPPTEPVTKATSAEPTPEELKRKADEMERTFKALEAVEKEIPRDTFDPKAIVDKVGRDPVKLFEWVRDNTYWVPYRGSLRGPTGVLMDRLGSSLDRALLLAELLRTAGHQVRLARAELTEEKAKELLPKLRSVPENPLPPAPPTSKDELKNHIEKYAKEYHFDAGVLQKNVDSSTFQAAKLAEELAQRVAEQTRAVAKAVGTPSKKDAEAYHAREAASQLLALRDHWWAQRLENDTWVELDPLLPDAEPGAKLAAPEEIITPDKKDARLHLDSKYCHELVIRIVIERWKKEGPDERVVLSHTLRPSDLFGARIALDHHPMKWPKELNLFEEKKPLEKLRTTVLTQDEWLPVLTVGTDRFIQSSFTDSGDKIDNPREPLLGGGAQKLGGSIGGLLGGGRIGQAPERKPEEHSHLTAEWIEYEIRTPDQSSQRIRRQVFDLVGPARRIEKNVSPSNTSFSEKPRLARGLALLGGTEILALPCQLSGDYVQHLATETMLANRQALLRMIIAVGSRSPDALIQQAKELKSLSGNLYALGTARQNWSRSRGLVYLKRINIFSHHNYLAESGRAELLACEGLDIVTNEVGVHSRFNVDPFAVRLEQGIADTNAETSFLSGCSTQANPAEMSARAGMLGKNLSVIKSARDATWQNVKLPKDVRARIERDLQEGHWVVFAAQTVHEKEEEHYAWWRLDPITGQILGMGERGWGQDTVEWAVIIGYETAWVVALLCIGKKLYVSPNNKISNLDYFNCACNGVGAGVAVGFVMVGQYKLAAAIAAAFFKGICA